MIEGMDTLAVALVALGAGVFVLLLAFAVCLAVCRLSED